MSDCDLYEKLTNFREPVIERIIESLELKPATRGLDVGCGIGRITGMLSKKIGPAGELIGLDISAELIAYAERSSPPKTVEFVRGDVNNLRFRPGSFDWIWSMDALWIGPGEFGCPADEPDHLLDRLGRILKPGGKICLAYWSSQKILPGHPLLEARLNASVSANAPYRNGMDPDHHIFRAKKWLSRAGFEPVEARTFVGEIAGPLKEADQTALAELYQMLWGRAEREVAKEDWEEFNRLCSPASAAFVPSDPEYYGFYTYTVFRGTKR
jgi:ubiquinone/menaquinone biosynthesis C-methylase UbiE